MAGAFLTPEELQRELDRQAGGAPVRTAGAFAIPQMAPAPDPFAGQTPEMAFGAEDPTVTTGDMGLAPQPQRMLAGAWDMIARKRMAGVPLSPDEEAMVASGERYKTEIGEPGAINALGEVSGVNGVRRGGENIAAGYETGSPLLMAAGAGEAAMSALPASALFKATAPIAKSIFASPLRAMGFGAATTLPGAALESQEAMAAKSREQIQRELSGMSKPDLQAYQRSIGVNPDGVVGQATIAAAMEADRRREADAAQRAEIERMAAQGNAEAAKEAARIKAEAEAAIMRDQARARDAAEQKQKQVATPIRELYPEYMPFLAALPPIAAAGMGARVMGRRTAAFNDEIKNIKERTEKALQSKNKPLASELNKMLLARQKEGHPSGFLPAIASGAGLGAKAAILPEELDIARGVPGAWERMTDIPTVGKRAGIGALVGGLSAGFGGEHRTSGMIKPKIDYSPEVNALKATRAPRGSGGGGGAKPPGGDSPPPASGDASVDDIAAAATQRQRRAAKGKAAQPAQSPPSSTAGQPAPPAPAQQSQPSGGSPRSSLPLSSYKRIVRVGDNTGAVIPRQFVPGQRGEPASGLHKALIKNDASVKELATNMVGEGQKLTAASFQAAAKERLGLEMSPGQANRVLRDLKADDALKELKANVDKARKAERARAQRAARAAFEKKKGD